VLFLINHHAMGVYRGEEV